MHLAPLDRLSALLDEQEQAVASTVAALGAWPASVVSWGADGQPRRRTLAEAAIDAVEPEALGALAGLLVTLLHDGAWACALVWEDWAVTAPDELAPARAWLSLGRRLASFHARQPVVIFSAGCAAGSLLRVRRLARTHRLSILAGPLAADAIVIAPPPDVFDALPWPEPPR